MDSRVTLRDLLQLATGWLNGNQAERVKKAISNSPAAQKIWNQLERTAQEVEQGKVALRSFNPDAGGVSVELIAAYLDDRLEKVSRQDLERRALRTPALMKELVLHFRQQVQEPAESLVSWGATEKLFRLGDSAIPAVARADARPAAEMVSIAVKPVGIPMARTVASRPPVERQSTSFRWWTAVATGVTVAAVGGIWMAAGMFNQSGSADRQAELVLSSGNRPAAGSVGRVDSELARGGLAAGGPASGVAAPNRPRVDALAGNWVLVDLNDPTRVDDALGQSGLQVDPEASVFHQQNGVIEDLTWLQLDGLVALREPGEELWFGPKAQARILNGLEWQTLPGSWVSARLGPLGEIVLDSDSSVIVNASVDQRMVGLELQAGRVGLKKLAADSKLKVRHDQAEWEISVHENGTSVGLDWQAGEPRLAVYAGSLTANGLLIRGRQQLVMSGASSSETGVPGTAVGSLQAKPLSESFVWLERPVKASLLSGVKQAELLASGNVVNDLSRLGEVNGAADRVLAQYLPAVLAPEAHLLGVLEGTVRKSREDALQWLMGLSPRSPKTRQLWRTIAEKSGAPEHTREFFRLLQLARNSAPVSEVDAQFLTSGLKHQRLFVREMSQLLLEISFGNTVQYEADAELGVRNAAADRWTKEILRAYRPANGLKR